MSPWRPKQKNFKEYDKKTLHHTKKNKKKCHRPPPLRPRHSFFPMCFSELIRSYPGSPPRPRPADLFGLFCVLFLFYFVCVCFYACFVWLISRGGRRLTRKNVKNAAFLWQTNVVLNKKKRKKQPVAKGFPFFVCFDVFFLHLRFTPGIGASRPLLAARWTNGPEAAGARVSENKTTSKQFWGDKNCLIKIRLCQSSLMVFTFFRRCKVFW